MIGRTTLSGHIEYVILVWLLIT